MDWLYHHDFTRETDSGCSLSRYHANKVAKSRKNKKAAEAKNPVEPEKKSVEMKKTAEDEKSEQSAQAKK